MRLFQRFRRRSTQHVSVAIQRLLGLLRSRTQRFEPKVEPREQLFFSGLELLSPDRSQVDVQGSLEISLRNPQDVFLLATYETRDGHSEPQDCGIDNGRTPHISCRFPRSGSYEVKLFSNRDVSGTFDFLGQLQANAN
jgi:hypothetical protein